MLLPIPDRFDNLADLEHANFANYVEIENLLPEEFLRSNKFVDSKKIVGIEYLKVTKNSKKNLWKKSISLSKEDFVDFEPLFTTFNKLVN